MKYLKTYTLFERVYEETKIFESLDNSQLEDIVSNCKDILLELDDSGLATDIIYRKHGFSRSSETNKEYIFYIKIASKYEFSSEKEEFNWSNIKDVVERLSEYLSYFGLEFNTPTIQSQVVMNPFNWEPEYTLSRCEIFVSEK
jgi:hypothetical protein